MTLRIILQTLCCLIYACTVSLYSGTPTWKLFGNLKEARHYFSVMPLGSTEALVIGGYTNSTCVLCGTPTRNCERIDVVSRSVVPAAPMNVAHAESIALLTNDSNIVIISGMMTSSSLTPAVELYDRKTGTWKIAGNLLIPRRQHTACFISSEEILVVGGRNASINTIAAAEIFNIRTGTSRRIADFPYPINLGVMEISKFGNPIVFSGRSGGGDSYRTTIIYGYDIVNNRWFEQGNTIDAVHMPQILRLPDSRLLVSGGSKREISVPIDASNVAAIESDFGFQEVGRMQTPRVWHGSSLWNQDSIMIIGGYNNNLTILRSTDWVNISNGQTTQGPLLIVPRVHFRAIGLNKVSQDNNPCVLAISGFSTSTALTPSIEILETESDTTTIPPAISSFTPTFATTGSKIIIIGAGFTGTTAVSFGGVSAKSFIIDSPTQITAVVGNGATGAVSVTTPRGTAQKTGFTVGAVAQVTTVIGGLGRGIHSIARDRSGNLFIPAEDQGKIYKISPDGQHSVFFSTTPGPVTFMGGAEFDQSGILYATFGGNKILKFTPDGQSSVFYDGTGLKHIYHVDFDKQGNLWTVDYDLHALVKITPDARMSIVYQGAPLSNPVALRFDNKGNLFISNYGNHSIVKMSPCGTIEPFYKGPMVSWPNNLTAGQSGNIYVACVEPLGSMVGHVITKITPEGAASIFAGSGIAGHLDGLLREARFNGPTGLLFLQSGEMYVTDYYSGYLRKILNVGELPVDNSAPVYQGPQLASFSPVSGTTGTVLTINGVGLSCITGVTIGGVPATSYKIISDTEVQVIVGSGATGAVRVHSPSGNTEKETFTFIPTPVIESFSPVRGIVGSSVVVRGRGFQKATAVFFGSSPASLFTVDSDIQITALVPPGAGSLISVQTPGGKASKDGFEVFSAPVITSFFPQSAGMGDTIVIKGSGFTAASSVHFGATTSSIAAVWHQVVSDSVVRAVVGSGASGSVIVHAPGGMAFKEGFTFFPVPEIFSFSPVVTTVANVGTLVYITISGRNFTGATAVTIGDKAVSTFKILSDSVIVALTGSGGIVTVITPGGSASKSALTYIVATTATPSTPPQTTPNEPPPVISELSPSCIAPGIILTIKGQGFQNVTGIKMGFVGGNTIPASFTVHSPTHISAIVVRGLATSTNFSVSVSGTTGTATRSGISYVSLPPVITAFSPGVATKGETIVMTGRGFQCVQSVVVGGVQTAFTVLSDTVITATIGAGASGEITVTTPAGTGRIAGFVYSPFPLSLLPSITGFSPSRAAVGATVTISGTNFSGVTPEGTAFTTTAVSIGGVAVQFQVLSATQISVVLPVGFSPSNTEISVTTPGGTVSATGFTFIKGPVITNFTPQTGNTGTKVVITGQQLSGATAVSFGGIMAQSFIVNSDTQITAVVGSGATGLVTVTTLGGIATRERFVFAIPEPSIRSFQPDGFTPGATLTITGNNFSGEGFTTTQVSIGGRVATIITVTPNTLVVIMPESGGDGRLSVVTQGGSTSACCLNVPAPPTMTKPPIITSFSPLAAATGTMVNITGEHFTDVMAVRFGGVKALSFRVDSPTLIRAVVGVGASGEVSVTTSAGEGKLAGFTFIPPPKPLITSFTPTKGAPGDTIKIYGKNLTGATKVEIESNSAAVQIVSYSVSGDTLITAILGSGPSLTDGVLRVTTPAGVANATGFTFFSTPTISSFSPVIAGRQQAVVIYGSGFSDVTSVLFGGVRALSFVVHSGERITAQVSDGASGSVSVNTRAGTATRPGFIFAPPPQITSFTPESARAGDKVTITGKNFISQEAVSVLLFGGIQAASYHVVSDTEIIAIPASGGASGEISLTTPGGVATKKGFEFLSPAPVILSFSPKEASEGELVTITGKYFTSASSVKFGGTQAVSFVVQSATQIVAKLGNGSSGSVAVSTPGGTVEKEGFIFRPKTVEQLSIKHFTPVSANANSTITITGTGFTNITGVLFGGVPALSYTVVSTTRIEAVVSPDGASGAVEVRSANGAASADGFRFLLEPVILDFSPKSATRGTVVIITGRHLKNTTAVRFGDTPAATFIVHSDEEVRATVGEGSTGFISLTTTGGSARKAGFTFTQPGVTLGRQDNAGNVASDIALLFTPKFRIYPNPVRSGLTIEILAPQAEKIRLLLRTVLGQEVWKIEERIAEGRFLKDIDMSGFSSGVYFLEYSDGVKRMVEKIIRE